MVSNSSQALQQLNALPLVKKIHAILGKNGGQARLVGGAIRDALISGQSPDIPDLDMAMTLMPDDAMALLENEGLWVLPTGLDHGTITVFDKKDDRVKIETTTLRHDVRTDGRHADVEFTADWQADAARRDFTINAIYLDQDGTLFDPFNGIDDLKHQNVRFIGDADTRIKEDSLRMLRFFRFYSKFGAGPPDQIALNAISRNAEKVTTLSGERIAMEMDKIMTLPAEGLSLMVNFSISNYLTKDGFDLETYEKFLSCFDDMMKPSLAGKYAALVPDGQATDFADRLKMSNHRRDAICYISTRIDDVTAWYQGHDDGEDFVVKAWPHLSNPEKPWAVGALQERYILSMIRSGIMPDPQFLQRLAAWKQPHFPLKGRDLIDAGFEAGQQIGDILMVLENHWVQHQFQLSNSDLLSLARGLDLDAIKR